MNEITTDMIREIANFDVKVCGVKQIFSFDDKPLCTEAQLKLSTFENNAEVEINIKYKELEKYNFEKADHRFVIDALSRPPAKKILIQYIRQQIAKYPEIPNVIMLDRLGWYRSGDRICYNAGNCVIASDNSHYITNPDLADKYRLEVDDGLSEQDAAKKVIRMLKVDVKYPMLFSAGLLGILRQLIIDAGVVVGCALYVYGRTQSMKTTSVKLCALMHNRSELQSGSSIQMLRTDSTFTASSAKLEKCKDTVMVLDDIFKTSDKSIVKDAKSTAIKLLRTFADNSPRETAHGDYKINGQLIITAEGLLDDVSDLGRCLILHFDKKPDKDKLTKAQSSPLALSTFYRNFIQYVCDNYYDIVSKIASDFEKGRKKIRKKDPRYSRLYDMGLLLKIVFDIFCDYAISIGALDEDGKQSLKKILKKCVKRQIKHQEKALKLLQMKDTQPNFARAVYIILENRDKYDIDKEDCFEEGGLIYIRSKVIVKYIYKVTKRTYSDKAICKYFRERGLSQVYGNSSKKTSYQKKHKNKRYLIIPKEDLCREAAAHDDCITDQFL